MLNVNSFYSLIYILILLFTNINFNIIVRTFFAGHLDHFYAVFSHHFHGNFDVFTLVLIPVTLLLLFGVPTVSIFFKTIRKHGLWQTCRMFQRFPMIFLFSTLTNIVFNFEVTPVVLNVQAIPTVSNLTNENDDKSIRDETIDENSINEGYAEDDENLEGSSNVESNPPLEVQDAVVEIPEGPAEGVETAEEAKPATAEKTEIKMSREDSVTAFKADIISFLCFFL